MSFQTIFDIQQSMTINTRRTIGQMYSRSGQITVAQYLTVVPWVFTVTPHNYLYYPQVRDVIQSIDNADRQLPQTITFSTAQVLRTSTTVSVTIHRPIIGTPSTGTLTAVGSNCYWSVIATDCPTYTLTPMTGGAFVNWNNPFSFREYIT